MQQERPDDAILAVQRLPAHLNRRDVLTDYFSMFGPVRSVHPNSACSEAIVTFAHPEHAKAALSRYVFNDPSIFLAPWRGQQSSARLASAVTDSPPSKTPFDAAASRRRARDEIDEKRRALLYNLTEQLKAILAKVADPNTTEKNKEALQVMLETIQKKIRILTPRHELESYEKRQRVMHAYMPEAAGWIPGDYAMEERIPEEEHGVMEHPDDMEKGPWAEDGMGMPKVSEGEEGASTLSASGAAGQVLAPVPGPMGSSPPKASSAVWIAPSADEVRKQIEYYLSDQNLCRDAFFHARISENPDGWVDLQLILNCKRIRSMGVKREDVIGALVESAVEVHEHGNAIRRRGNAPLPQLVASSAGDAAIATAAGVGFAGPHQGQQVDEEALQSGAAEAPASHPQGPGAHVAVEAELVTAPAPMAPPEPAAPEEHAAEAFDDADFEPVEEVHHPWSEGVSVEPAVEAAPMLPARGDAEYLPRQPAQAQVTLAPAGEAEVFAEDAEAGLTAWPEDAAMWQ